MINSPLNYTGNKYKLLTQIMPYLNNQSEKFVDVFAGSGLVGLNSDCAEIVLNDNNKTTIELLEYFNSNSSDKIINTIECGSNAISTIISTFTTGAILIRHPVSLSLSNELIDVSCNGYTFSCGVDLVYYLDNEYPFPKGSFDRRMS